MAFETGLHLKQQQKLVMTPMLQQALKILQLNTLELSELVRQEIDENPMLEETVVEPAEGEVALPEAAADEAGEGAPAASPETALVAETEAPGAEAEPAPMRETTPEVALDTPGALPEDNWQDYFDDDGTDYGREKENDDSDKQGYENFLSKPPSLQEHLLGQLQSSSIEKNIRDAATELIGSVDERGYLAATLEETAQRIQAPLEDVEKALVLIQDFDPNGVAARDLRECLLIQLKARNLPSPLAVDLVTHHLQDLEKRRPAQLAEITGSTPEEVEEALRVIRTLEPVPGRPFGWEPNPDVTVDAVVFKDEEGNYVVQLLDSHMPRLSINRYYRAMLKASGGDKEATRTYLNERYQSAVWLIKSIDQRRKTLQRVLEYIVEHQKGFLDEGPEAFRPLTLREVAEQASLHESTISRVTTNKYVQTPRGIFPLKYFFSGGLQTDSGVEASTWAIKEKLKALLESEDPFAPYSDQKLMAMLSSQGIHIARRTVAKYREEIKVPPAHLRRKA